MKAVMIIESPLTLVPPGHNVPALILRICLPGTGTPTPSPCPESGALLPVDDPYQDTAGLNAQACQRRVCVLRSGIFASSSQSLGLPGGAGGKESACQCRKT